MIFKRITDIIHHQNWFDFIKQIQNISTKNIRKYAFRGQSNHQSFLDIKKWEPWNLKSSLQRNYESSTMPILIDHYDRLIKNLDKYKQVSNNHKDNNQAKSGLLNNLADFRHIGIPTPLIDFTFDPLTALYFAVIDIKKHGVVRVYDNDPRHVSIFQINLDLLSEYFSITKIDQIRRYMIFSGPVDHISIIDNIDKFKFEVKNLKLQNGLFIYIDSSFSLESTLNEKTLDEDIKITSKPITIHKIPYDSICNDESDLDVYTYLILKKRIGLFLFEYPQSISYDFKNGKIINGLHILDYPTVKKTKIKDKFKKFGLSM